MSYIFLIAILKKGEKLISVYNFNKKKEIYYNSQFLNKNKFDANMTDFKIFQYKSKKGKICLNLKFLNKKCKSDANMTDFKIFL